MDIVLFCVAAVLVLVAGAGLWWTKRGSKRSLLLERFVVTLKTGETFDGLLAADGRKAVRLVDAYALDGNDRVSIDGDLFLPSGNVAYMQRPGGNR